jgi:hypothetical protein
MAPGQKVKVSSVNIDKPRQIRAGKPGLGAAKLDAGANKPGWKKRIIPSL